MLVVVDFVIVVTTTNSVLVEIVIEMVVGRS